MKNAVLGSSVQGRELLLTHFGVHSSCDLFLFAAVHGDETEAAIIGRSFYDWCAANEDLLVQNKRGIAVLPLANPDGFHLKTRVNANGVDLNRNMDTKDWTSKASTSRYNPGTHPLSEPESRALKDAVERLHPRLIISLHTFDPQININGPAHPWAKVLSAITGYPMNEDIGYPTPGSFGTWAGWERSIPTITFEIRRFLPADSEEWGLCHKALLEVSLLTY